MADAQIFQIIQAGRVFAVVVQCGVIGREAHELAAPLRFYTAVPVSGKVRHMHLPHAAGVGRDVGAPVLLPAVGGGLCQVHHHAAGAVGPGAAGVGVHDLMHAAIREVDAVDVIRPVQVAGQHNGPDAAIAAAHFVYAQLFRARLGVGAGGIQADHDPTGSGSPQLEGGSLRRWICAEVAAVVIGQLTGLMPVHE